MMDPNKKKNIIRIIMLILAGLMLLGVFAQIFIYADENPTDVVIDSFETGNLKTVFDEQRGSLDPNNITELTIKSGKLNATDMNVFQMLSGIQKVDLSGAEIDGGIFPAFIFMGRGKIQTVLLPKNTTTVGNGAMQYCNELTTVIFPDSVTEIGSNAFENCVKLEAISLPAGLVKIGDTCFSGCSSLSSIDIPDNVTIIPKNLFARCSSLTEVHLGKNVATIEDYAFTDCSNLKTLNIWSENAPKIGNGILKM